MANRDLLKEAIADAKAVKETAIANAKAALEEAFTPMLREKLAAKIAEMDEMDEEVELKEADEMEEGLDESYEMDEAKEMDEMKKDMDEAEEKVDEVDLDELLRELDELDEEETMDERLGTINDPVGDSEHGNLAEAEEGEGEEEGEEAEGEEEEEIDLENMDEGDLKKFIEDVIADMVASGELEGNMEGGEGEEEMGGEEEMEITERKKSKLNKMVKENQSSSPKLLDFVDGDNFQDLKTYKMLGFNIGIDDPANNQYFAELDFKGYDWLAVLAMLEDCEREGVKPFMTWNGENYEFEEAMKLADEKAADDEMDGEGRGTRLEAKSMKKELDEAYKALESVKAELNEVNLLNAKLLYTNKIFKSKNLGEAQKVKVLEAFDKATSVKEAKLVYETLSTGVASNAKKPMNESLIRGGASKPAGVSEKKPIMEANDQVARWQKLAGIK
jgi:hypothetical protein